MTMLDTALAGIRVIDLSQYLPGPFATQILADLGAEVLKIEPPAGDPMRRFMLRDRDGVSPLYKQVNGGKTVVRLDLKSAAGQGTLATLLKAADVLLESFRPGVLERLGFSRQHLAKINPRLIHCALSGFGQTGPSRLRAGHDLTYLALSGMLDLVGTKECPVIPFPPVSDYATGKQAALALLGALLGRVRGGQGCFIDVSLYETALSWQAFALTTARRAGQAFARGRDLLTGGAACYQIYRTADHRFLALAAIEEKFWEAFCLALDRPIWIERQYEPFPQRELIGEVAEVLGAADRDEWLRHFTTVDCCLEPVLNAREAGEHPQAAARGLVQEVPNPDPLLDVLFPALADELPPSPRTPLREILPDQALAAWSVSDKDGPLL